MTEEELTVRILADWIICDDCQKLHHPDDVNPDYFHPGALCYGCSKSVFARGEYCQAWCLNTERELHPFGRKKGERPPWL